jgi:hypothetical protein
MDDDSKKPYPGEILREPTTEWESEVIERVLAGEDEETAIAGVIQKWLNAGRPEALVGAIKLFHTAGKPVPALTRHLIVAMFEEDPNKITNEPIPVHFNIKSRSRTQTDDEFWPVWHIRSGHRALAEGREPYREFWKTLADGLIAGHPKDFVEEPPPIAIKIQVKFLRKGRGRPPDPKLAINKDLIGKLVAREKQGRGEYASAVRLVQEGLKRDKQGESWQGELPSERTIRRAYDDRRR